MWGLGFVVGVGFRNSWSNMVGALEEANTPVFFVKLVFHACALFFFGVPIWDACQV